MRAANTKRAAAPQPAVSPRVTHAEAEALIHHQTRAAHREERSQDYVEAIAELIRTCGEARAVDLARKMGVTHVTVGKIVSRMQREGLLTRQPYRAIFLTEKGKQIAEQVRRRHELVLEFLIAIGVKPATAAIDAEGIEHHVSEETLAVFARFLRPHANQRK